MSKSRLEAFSDGVLAIAITLLVIELRPPKVEAGERLAQALWRQWPSYVAYLVSFVTIGVIWLNHHWILDQAVQVDGPALEDPVCSTTWRTASKIRLGRCEVRMRLRQYTSTVGWNPSSSSPARRRSSRRCRAAAR